MHDEKVMIRPGVYDGMHPMRMDVSANEESRRITHRTFVHGERQISGGPILDQDLKFLGMVHGGEPADFTLDGRNLRLNTTSGTSAAEIAEFANSTLHRLGGA